MPKCSCDLVLFSLAMMFFLVLEHVIRFHIIKLAFCACDDDCCIGTDMIAYIDCLGFHVIFFEFMARAQNATRTSVFIHSSCRAWMANECFWNMTIFLWFCIRTGLLSDGCFVKTRIANKCLAMLSKSACKVNSMRCLWLSHFGELWCTAGRWRLLKSDATFSCFCLRTVPSSDGCSCLLIIVRMCLVIMSKVCERPSSRCVPITAMWNRSGHHASVSITDWVDIDSCRMWQVRAFEGKVWLSMACWGLWATGSVYDSDVSVVGRESSCPGILWAVCLPVVDYNELLGFFLQCLATLGHLSRQHTISTFVSHFSSSWFEVCFTCVVVS